MISAFSRQRSLVSNQAMNRTFLLFLVLALQIVSCLQSFAWSSAGHMVIAAEAYRQLTPKTKAKVDELLKFHPDYEKWTNSFSADSSSVNLELFVFMQASTWPDNIRRKGSEYDHPQWHYIDYPLKPFAFPM